MDSRLETLKHIAAVQELVIIVTAELSRRAMAHDFTKLESPEVELFDELTPLLAGTTYGSPEYAELLRRLKPALDHHYAAHRHHPEHYPNGICDMSLIDLIEMICDWMAATRRHNDGDVLRSIDINQKRFGYSDELAQILRNTVAAIVEAE